MAQSEGPLVEKRGFTIKLAGEANVDDRPAVGVRVPRKDRQDVTLCLDQKSGLLVKSVFRIKAPEQDFKEVKAESWYPVRTQFPSKDGLHIANTVSQANDT